MKKKQAVTLTLLAIVFAAFAYTQIQPYYQFLTQTLQVSPTEVLFDQISVKQNDARTNILILGKPDDDHDGANLTDSITFLSYNHTNNALLSMGIPRDIWSPTLQDKINSAYAYGEAKQKGGGIKLAQAEMSALLDKPIHYTVVISFSKFEALIDALGGIEVDVQHGFTDEEFPIAGKENDECFGMDDYSCRYQTITFEEGRQKMDGERALMFVRSRHAQGDEGSDFSRSKRQQIVLAAIEDALIAEARAGNMDRLTSLYQTIDSLVERTITNDEAIMLGKQVALNGNLSRESVHLPHELFETPELWVYERYVLIPQQDQFDASIECIYDSMKIDGCIPSQTASETTQADLEQE